MVLKRLDELSNDELKNEFEKAGLEGKISSEAEYLIRLTIYLVNVSEDPFTFLYDIHENSEKTKPEVLDVVEEAIENKPDLETVGNAVVSSSWFADGVSAGSSSVPLPLHLPLIGGSSMVSAFDQENGKSKSKYLGEENDGHVIEPNSLAAGSAVVSWLADVVSAESVSVSSTLPRSDSSSFKSLASDFVSFSSFVSVPTSFWFQTWDPKPDLWPPDLE
jgi:hypothetical protein